MSSGPPMCPICEKAHWLGREPHDFGKKAPVPEPKKKPFKKKAK